MQTSCPVVSIRLEEMTVEVETPGEKYTQARDLREVWPKPSRSSNGIIWGSVTVGRTVADYRQ